MIYTIQEIKDKISPICKKYDVKAAYLFGSYARGEANEESDIDIRLDRTGSIPLSSLLGLSGFRLDCINTFKKDFDIISAPLDSKDDPSFPNNLLNDEVLIYESEEIGYGKNIAKCDKVQTLRRSDREQIHL